MNITEIIPTELSGFCDIKTEECVVADAEAPPWTELDDSSHDPIASGSRPAVAALKRS